MIRKRYTAVLDRIVDGTDAVLLIEDEGKTVDELIIHINELPSDGRHESAVFNVKLIDDELLEAEYLPEEEAERLERVREKMERTAVSLDELESRDTK